MNPRIARVLQLRRSNAAQPRDSRPRRLRTRAAVKSKNIKESAS